MNRHDKIVRLFFIMIAFWLLMGVGNTVKNLVSHDIGAFILVFTGVMAIVSGVGVVYLIFKEMFS